MGVEAGENFINLSSRDLHEGSQPVEARGPEVQRDASRAEGSREVPLSDVGREHSRLSAELRAAFDRTLDKGTLELDDEVPRFEREFAAYCGVDHAVGVSSGTAALALGMTAAGIGPGDEVIVPAYAPLASALSILHAGATPVLCDVRTESGLIDVDSAADMVGPHTAAIVAVHLFGQVCEFDEIRDLADRQGLVVIEDAAEAAGARYRTERVGSLGDFAAFSFHPSSNLGALGNGGAVCTNDPTIASRVRGLCSIGQQEHSDHAEIGFEARLDGLQASILRIKLPYLEQKNAARRAWAELYRVSLPSAAVCVPFDPNREGVYHHFPIRVTDRERVRRVLRAADIAADVYCDPPLHRHPALRGYRLSRSGLGASDDWSEQELSLPMFPELTAEEVTRVAEILEPVLT